MKKWYLANSRSRVVSIILHTLLILGAYVFQRMIFPYLRLYGLVPLLLPLASTGIAVYEGRDAGGIAGLFAGILCDVSFNEPTGVFTVLLTFLGLLAGMLTDSLIKRGFASFFLCSVAVLVVCAFAQMFTLLFFERVPPRALLMTALWQTAYSLIFVFPIWGFSRALGKRAQRFSASGRPL